MEKKFKNKINLQLELVIMEDIYHEYHDNKILNYINEIYGKSNENKKEEMKIYVKQTLLTEDHVLTNDALFEDLCSFLNEEDLKDVLRIALRMENETQKQLQEVMEKSTIPLIKM